MLFPIRSSLLADEVLFICKNFEIKNFNEIAGLAISNSVIYIKIVHDIEDWKYVMFLNQKEEVSCNKYKLTPNSSL